MQTFNLPKDFLFGTATSGFQIEGSNTNSSWFNWVNEGNIQESLKKHLFCDHWNRIDEDIDLIKKMNSKVYRMSIEWSRIEPRENEFDNKAINHYKYEIKKLIDNGIKPMITLHHFSNPIWFENKGAWINKNSVDCFLKFGNYVVNQLSEYVRDWITINEPNAYLYMGYLDGGWPPGKKLAFRYYLRSAKNMIKAHQKAYQIIHEIGLKKNINMNVGAAHHIRDFIPVNNNFIYKKITSFVDCYFHDLFIDRMTLNNRYNKDEKCADFLGINYYTKNNIGINLNPFKKLPVIEAKNDLGWEIYPEGLYHICKKYYDKFKLPVYITENGICDNNDTLRIKFIYEHVLQIKKLIDIGVDIKRYYHWSLMDNFEWLEGINARFGLIHVDYMTLERTFKKSGFFYSELSKNNSVTSEMIRRYE